MSEEQCECPLLKFAAQTERMAGWGIVPADGRDAVSTRINALTVGHLRAEHGCTGPRFNTCRYYYSSHGSSLVTDPNVPLLKRKLEDGQDHKYL